MAISFQSIPAQVRAPSILAEYNNTKASRGASSLPYRALLLGQKTAAGTATPNVLQRAVSRAQVLPLAGRGSMLDNMARAYFGINQFTETWILPVSDDGAGVAATLASTVTGPATETGTLPLYVGAVSVPVAVTSGDAATAIATAIAAAVNANLDLPVTAAAVSAVVTFTYRHKGLVGNGLDIRLAAQPGDKTPAGVGMTTGVLAGGTTDPSLAAAIAAMGDQWFHIIANPYTSASNLTALETELLSRWGPLRSIDGFAISSPVGTQGTLSTLGNTRNSPFTVFAAQPGKNPIIPSSEFAAAVAAVVAYYGAIDSSLPFSTLEIPYGLPPAVGDRFTKFPERNLMLGDGIGTTHVGAGEKIQIEKLITTYKTNSAGASDTSYQELTTVLNLMELRYTFREWIKLRYPRAKLMDDGPNLPQGQPIMTPSIGRAEAVAWFIEMGKKGKVDPNTIDQFKADLLVERDSDVNRLNWVLPPDLANQFNVGAISIEFRL